MNLTALLALLIVQRLFIIHDLNAYCSIEEIKQLFAKLY